MEKALEVLKHYKKVTANMPHGMSTKRINEAIAELEEAMKPKTCSTCKELEDIGKSYRHCRELEINISHSTESTFCCNRHEPKDNA